MHLQLGTGVANGQSKIFIFEDEFNWVRRSLSDNTFLINKQMLNVGNEYNYRKTPNRL